MEKNKFAKKVKILLTLIVGVLFLCSMSATQSSAEEVFTVGIIAPLSGPAKLWGQGVLRGVELAADNINAKGGLRVQGKTYKVKFKAYDDKYKGSEGATAANSLIFKDNVRYIFGSIATTSNLAFQVITEPNKVLVHANGYFKGTLSAEKPYTFRYITTSREYAGPTIKALLQYRPELKTYATVARNDANGKSVTADYVAAADQNKLKLLKNEYYAGGMEDFYPLLTRLKAENPDVIMDCAMPPGEVAKMVKQARQLGIKSVFLGHSGAVENPDDFIAVAEKANVEKDFYYATDYDADSKNPRVIAFVKQYKAKYNEICYGFVDPCYYDAMDALLYSIQQVQSFDTEKIKNFYETKLEKSKWVGVMGPMHFTGKDYYGINHQRKATCFFAKFENGKQKVLKQTL